MLVILNTRIIIFIAYLLGKTIKERMFVMYNNNINNINNINYY